MLTHALRLGRRPRLTRLEGRTAPAIYTVTSLADSGLGTLREGVINCNSTPALDIIEFDPSLFGTIKLTSGQINITEALEIRGTGTLGLTVSGNNSSRIFQTSSAAAGTDIRISDLTLTAGKASIGSGGAMLCGDEDIVLTNCVISNNTAAFDGGAIYLVNGSFTATNCRFINNSAALSGGAVSFSNAFPSANIQRCEFASNTANSGGAAYVNGTAIFEACTLSSNTATVNGGAIAWNPTGSLDLVNSTLSKNTAQVDGGAVHALVGTFSVYVDNCTLTANTATTGDGGAIHRSSSTGDTTIESSIVSGNNAGGVGPDIASPGTVNVDNSAVGSSAGFFLTGSGNLPFGANLQLGPLASNGGPTKTHRPADTSPVIDAGTNVLALQFDQRGVTRVIGSAPDIGAFEVPTALVVTNANNSGAGSLRQVIGDANIDLVADAVTFDPVFFSTAKTISLTGTEIPITAGVSIFGPSLSAVTVTGNFSRRAFNMNLPALVVGELYVSGMTFTECRGVGDGGAILSNRPVTLFGVAMTGNRATDDGGAVAAPTVTADYCVFTSNVAESEGGAVSANDFVANDSVFQNNSAVSRGGAIDAYYFLGGQVALRRCSVMNNLATIGGGIDADTGVLLEQCTVAGNKSTSARGGGTYFTGANAVTIRNSTISGNQAVSGGAAVALSNFTGTFTVQNCTITANQNLGSGGGGISRFGGTATINLESCIVTGNLPAGTGQDLQTTGTVDARYCLIGSKSGVSTFIADATTNALLGADAKLGPLAHNGGPTLTHLLQAGSPAMNAGSNPAPAATFDQRGAHRLWGGGVDIGALEVQTDTTFVVDITADESDGNVATGDLSLREALEVASAALESSDTVTFDPVAFAGAKTIALTLGQIPVSGPVEIQGTGASRLTVSGNNQGRIFNLFAAPPATNVVIADMAVVSGRTNGVGGALVMAGQHLTLNRCVFAKNVSEDKNGGAIAVESLGSLTAVDCAFIGNSAAGSGGAIAAVAPVVLVNCTLSANVAKGNGGAIFLDGTTDKFTAVIRNSTVSGNATNVNGGGIALLGFNGPLVVQNSTITANAAAGLQFGQGGGIARVSGGGVITIESSIVAQNSNPLSPDVFSTGTVSVNYSLVGNAAGFSLTGANNLAFGTDPKLGPLADHGGPTQTHALKTDSPCIGKGSNPAVLNFDQRGTGYPRVANGAVDIGSVEVAAPARVVSAGITGSPVQRSRVTSVTVVFDRIVTLSLPTVGAFELRRQDGAAADLTVAVDHTGPGTVVTLTFTGALSEFGSLADGRYTLRVRAAKVDGGYFDGNGDGVPGDDYVLVSAGTAGIFRLFGDNDGDADVDASDYGAFRQAFGGASNLAFDYDNDGDVDATDFGQFRLRFGTTV